MVKKFMIPFIYIESYLNNFPNFKLALTFIIPILILRICSFFYQKTLWECHFSDIKCFSYFKDK